MFKSLCSNPNLQYSLEDLEVVQEKDAKKKEFLESRLQRRWNYNKSSPDIALKQLSRFKTEFEKIEKSIQDKTFNVDKFNELISQTNIIPASLMKAGLTQIPDLAKIFSDIASLPPLEDKSFQFNKFRNDMTNIIKKHTNAYDQRSYKIEALFMTDKSQLKTRIAPKELGYDKSFMTLVKLALDDVQELITTMKQKEDLLHKLSASIVDVLMGPKANDYLHARRQFQITCTIYNSCLTIAWQAYMSLALLLAKKMTTCYD